MRFTRLRSTLVPLAGVRLLVPALCVLALLPVFVLLPQVAQAATIPVTGGCTLPDAILAANLNAVVGGCLAGSGADLIVLSAPANPVSFNASYNANGPNATPNITSTMTISGGVAGAVVERSGGGDARLFHVATSGNLTLVNVTVQNGRLMANDGGAIYNQGKLTLLNSVIFSNTAATNGGGLFNDLAATATLTNSQIVSNSATNGGGFYNDINGTATISGTDLISNTAAATGGGVYNSGSITLTASDILSNTALGSGGGLANEADSTATLTSIHLLWNTAQDDGGGFYNHDNATATIAGTQFLSNTASAGDGGNFYNAGGSSATFTSSNLRKGAAQSGGGFYNDATSSATLTTTDLVANRAGEGAGFYNLGTTTITGTTIWLNQAQEGGGFYNDGAATLTNAELFLNAATDGGGFSNDVNGTVTLTNSNLDVNIVTNQGGGFANRGTTTWTGGQLAANAANQGGGFYNNGTVSVTQVRLQGNRAASAGSAFYQEAPGATTVHQSCLVENFDIAVVRNSGPTVDAQNNWWGAPDGPSGAGVGAGDSVSSGVDFTPFLTSAILGCPLRSAEIAFSQRVAPAATLLPGQPLTYTLSLTNTGALTVHNVYVSDALPAGFVLDAITAQGAPHRQSGNTTIISDIIPGQVVTVTVRGHVNAALSADLLLVNTGSVTSGLIALITDSISANVVVPTLKWSSATYQSNEGGGDFNATLELTPANPYSAVSVQVAITDSAQLLATALQTVTFPPGSSSQIVTIADVDDQQILTRTVQLALRAPAGAALGSPNQATLTFADNDEAGLLVSIGASVAQAQVGKIISYTVRITNTGDVPFTTITATADHQGRLEVLEGALAPGATRSAATPYIILSQDVGELTNSVTVTATDAAGGAVERTAAVTITVTEAVTPKRKIHLPVIKGE